MWAEHMSGVSSVSAMPCKMPQLVVSPFGGIGARTASALSFGTLFSFHAVEPFLEQEQMLDGLGHTH